MSVPLGWLSIRIKWRPSKRATDTTFDSVTEFRYLEVDSYLGPFTLELISTLISVLDRVRCTRRASIPLPSTKIAMPFGRPLIGELYWGQFY